MESHTDNVPDRRTLPRVAVSAEMIAILAFGVMLAGLVFTTGSWIHDDLQVLRNDVRDVQYGLGELRERVVRVETAVSELDERMTSG